jgi:hypothetical protein
MHYSDNLDRLNFIGDELGDDKVDRQTRQGISKANSTGQRGLPAKVVYWPGVSGVEGLKSTAPGPCTTCCDEAAADSLHEELVHILSLNPPSLPISHTIYYLEK